jgi:hypothetical protein
MKWPTDMPGLIQDSKSGKTDDKRAWDLSLLFLQGNQWLQYDRRMREYESMRTRKGRGNKLTVNLMLNIYRNVLSHLTLAYPSVVVMPASPSNEDILKAKSAEMALRYHWEADTIKDTLSKGLEWLLTCGTVGFHTYYWSEKERVHTEAVSPYDLFFEKDVSDFDESEWVAIRSYHTKQRLKDSYPKAADSIEKLGGSDTSEGLLGEIHPSDRIEVYEIYWRDGRHAIMAGNIYLFKEEDYPTDPHPIQLVRYTEVPLKLWGIGLLEPLIDLQHFYNKSRTQIMMNVELMGNPKILIPKTAGVDSKAFTNRPGEKIFYNAAGGKPEQLTPVPIPGYVLDNITRIQSEMQDVAGIHSVSLGKRAVGISSGKAMNVITSRDMSQLQITQTRIEKATARLAETTLVLMKQFYDEPKMMRMMDQAGQVIFNQLDATTLVDDPEVFLEAGSLFRNEALDRDAKVLELLQLGLIEKDQALQEISFRTGNAFMSEKIMAMSHARDTLGWAIQGDRVEIFSSDDIKLFVKVFGDFMRSPDYYELTEERQNYIADIFAALTTDNQGPEAYAEALAKRKVWPRPMMPGEDPKGRVQSMVGVGSPEARQQLVEEQLDMTVQKRVGEDMVSRSKQRDEALISPVGGGY